MDDQRLSQIESRLSGIDERLTQKVGREELYQWKDAILDRLKVEIEGAFERHESRDLERRRVHGHETAEQIRSAINDLRKEIVGLLGKSPGSSITSVERPISLPSVPPWVWAIGGMLIGSLFGQYILPTLFRFGFQKLIGG